MSACIEIDYAVASEKGEKAENADAADAVIPEGAVLRHKGLAAALCDGMSSAEGGVEAAQLCVRGFLDDYYSTPDSWTVKTAATKVLGALNRWLWSQGQARYESARGMVTTFTGLVVKSTTAHCFHVGDSRLYLFRDGELERLTQDHRIWVSKDREFLSRAMGVDAHIDIDYRRVAVQAGDLFLFTSDGVTGFVTDHRLRRLLREHGDHLQTSADRIMEEALRNGSHDNVTCQLLKILALPERSEDELLQWLSDLPFPPPLQAGMKIDDYEILRPLHISSRSEVFVARDSVHGDKVILKTPSENYRDDPGFLDAFLHEEWVGRRIDNPHVLRVRDTPHRRFLYNVSEYVEGQTLRQWIDDHPRTHINTAREYLDQIAAGLRAFHRLEMIHLDLKPENILIDKDRTLKIIDFGSTRVAGTSETRTDDDTPRATLDYGAPECLSGRCSNRSDIYSLGVIAYELLTGALPYGAHDRPLPAHKLRYVPASRHNPAIQPWVDGALRKAVHPDPSRRYDSLSEFLYDLSHPNPDFLQEAAQPLMERNPLGFWKALSGLLVLVNLLLLYLLQRS